MMLLAACAGSSYAIQGTEAATGIDGEVEVEPDDFGNSHVRLRLEHVPPPDRLVEGEDAQYVVWFVERDGTAQKAGFLDYDPSDREGRLDTVTTLDSFEVVVTAEDSSTVRAPRGPAVARRDVHR